MPVEHSGDFLEVFGKRDLALKCRFWELVHQVYLKLVRKPRSD